MVRNRQEAVKIAQQRSTSKFSIEDRALTTYFKENIFDDVVIEKYLTPEKFKKYQQAKVNRTAVDEMLADDIAKGMKAWAQAKGATHYTHWFQPLTGSSAEKHDSFTGVNYDGTLSENFNGQTLFSKNQTHPRFQAVVSDRHSRLEDIPPGILRPRLLSGTIVRVRAHCAYHQCTFPSPESRWIPKHRSYARLVT